jgi:hypothetical protein
VQGVYLPHLYSENCHLGTIRHFVVQNYETKALLFLQQNPPALKNVAVIPMDDPSAKIVLFFSSICLPALPQFVGYSVQLQPHLEPLLIKICSLDRPLGEAIQRYHAALVKRLPRPGYAVESYPFGQPMFVEGKPSGGSTSHDLLPSQSGGFAFPLGIIVNGYAEITDYVFGAGTPRLAPHAILKPGSFIGLFEFMDGITEGKISGVPDWTITAGTASLCCAFNTSNDAFAKHLRRRFRPQEVNEHAVKNENSLVQQLMHVEDIKKRFSQWTTDVMYFGEDWFNPLLENDVGDPIGSTGLDLIRILGQRAWHASSRIRPSASSIAPFFFGGRADGSTKFTRPELHERQRSIHIFTSLYDLYSSRRPMFVPERRNGPWGPIGEICGALQGYDENPFILRPEYLSDLPNSVAFMPAENVAPALVESGGAHERAVMNALNVIDAAARLDEKTEGRSILSEFGNMIEALSVRLPAGKEGGRTRSASVVTRDVLRNPQKGVRYSAMEEGVFFAPYDIKLERPGAEFFKTCIRFAIPS